jgi:hypothetical protein
MERELTLVLLKGGAAPPHDTTIKVTDGMSLAALKKSSLEELGARYPRTVAGLTLDDARFYIFSSEELRAALSGPAFVPPAERGFPLLVTVGNTFVGGKDCVLVTAPADGECAPGEITATQGDTSRHLTSSSTLPSPSFHSGSRRGRRGACW